MQYLSLISHLFISGLIVSILDFHVALAETKLDQGQVQKKATVTPLILAKEAYEKKNLVECVQILQPLVENLSREGSLLLGTCHHEQKNYSAALNIYSAALAKNPEDPEFKTRKAAELGQTGKDLEALSMLKEVIEKNKTYYPAYEATSQIFIKRNNKYELRLLYQDVLERIGQKPEIILGLCKLSTEDRLYELATKYCSQGQQLSPSEATGFIYMGIALNETGRPEEAEKSFIKAADGYPASELAQLSLAKFYEDRKNSKDAFKYYQRAVLAQADSIKGLVGVGVMGIEILKLQDSLDSFRKVCKLDRKTLPHFRRAVARLRAAKNTDWLQKFESAIETCN